MARLLASHSHLNVSHASEGLHPSTSAPVLRPTGRRTRLIICNQALATTPPSTSTTTLPSIDLKTAEYNRLMNDRMGWGKNGANPYEYYYDRGLYYHEIDRNLLCGSQPRNGHDIDELKKMQVTHILNLQQDRDLHHWGVNLGELQHRCQANGMTLIRRPARDFDPHSLRKTIPSAVKAIHEVLSSGGRIYVHCTAGLGRAPALCIAYLYWFRQLNLNDAYKHLTDIRPCGPKRDAIRGATFDLLSDQPFEAFDHLPQDAYASLSDEDKYAIQYRVMKL